MTSYLLTGAAGFIGARVAGLLLDAGHGVIGLDNLNDAYDARLKHWRLERLQACPGFEFHTVDITNRADLEAVWARHGLGDCAAVINLAARAGVRPSVTDPWIYYATNVAGCLNLLDLCRQHGVRKFVQASSSSLYGAHNALPYREDGDVTRPLSPYAASKLAAETLCYSYHHLHGLDVTILRYFTVYGPAGRPDMSPFRFVQWISEDRPVIVYGDGSQRRDFTYVDDIARGTITSLRPLGYAILNLGADRPVPLLDFIAHIEHAVGRTARLEFRPAHPADVPATWADITRASQALGWRPQVGLAEGVSQLAAWYAANRAWASQIATG